LLLNDGGVYHGAAKRRTRLLTASYHQFKARSGDRHPKTQDALRRLVTLYEAWRKPDQAAHFRALLAE